MKFTTKYICFLSLIILFISSCSNDTNIDKDLEKPTITVNYTEGFPQGCTQLVKGKTYNFRAKVTDNKALVAYSLDIHNNFDHHTHDDQITECQLGEIKTAVNPLIFIENYTTEGDDLTNYEINIPVTIPDDIDTGDYHCSYSVTDKTGWQAITSIDIQIIE